MMRTDSPMTEEIMSEPRTRISGIGLVLAARGGGLAATLAVGS
jgi:hypothetical protein